MDAADPRSGRGGCRRPPHWPEACSDQPSSHFSSRLAPDSILPPPAPIGVWSSPGRRAGHRLPWCPIRTPRRQPHRGPGRQGFDEDGQSRPPGRARQPAMPAQKEQRPTGQIHCLGLGLTGPSRWRRRLWVVSEPTSDGAWLLRDHLRRGREPRPGRDDADTKKAAGAPRLRS